MANSAIYAAENNEVNLKYRYIVNLSSSLESINPQSIPQLELFDSYRLYEAKFKTPDKTWHRLRLGFFKSNEKAEEIRKKVLEYYPRAWVSVTSEKERRASETTAIVAQGAKPRKISSRPPPSVNASANAPLSSQLPPPFDDGEEVTSDEEPVSTDMAIVAPGVVGVATPAAGDVAVEATEAAIPEADDTGTGVAETGSVPEDGTAIAETESTSLSSISASKSSDLIVLTRQALTAGEYRKAIQFATASIERDGNNPEAMELLGLARERNGQLAHAKAEYEKYLGLYPKGEDAERVQQRLAGLVTAAKPDTPVPKKMASNEEKKKVVTPPWRTLGSLSQFYYRDERSVDDEENEVDLSRFITTLNLTSRKVTEKYEHRIEFTGDHSYDFLDEEHDGRFTNFYYEMVHRSSRRHLRIGRQSHSSGGVLGRFDGINAGVEITADIKLDATAGYLLDPEGLFNYESNRKFISANLDLGHIFDRIDFNVYLIRQYADDVVDRYAIGTETRYFDPSYSMFNLIDYDLFYDELNVFLLNNNWIFSDGSTFFVNLDFRKSPYLTTYNAVISQPFRTIDELLNTYTLDEIYQLALDRTANVKTFSLGGSHPLVGFLEGYGDYQLSADLTVTNTGPMPASGGVEEFGGTGNEYFLGTQLIGNNIFTNSGDVSILSLRVGVAQNHNDYTFSLNSRLPIAGRTWRINPVIQYNRRESTINEDTRDTTRASIKVEFRPSNSWHLETQVGIDNTHEKVGGQAVSSDSVFFNAGYRWDF